jgi:hypothetical protein
MEEKVTIEQLITLLEEAKVDYHKFYVKGNKAAATRLRKSLQDVSKLCKTSREQVLEHKKVL